MNLSRVHEMRGDEIFCGTQSHLPSAVEAEIRVEEDQVDAERGAALTAVRYN
jgi:hypothetical protein